MASVTKTRKPAPGTVAKGTSAGPARGRRGTGDVPVPGADSAGTPKPVPATPKPNGKTRLEILTDEGSELALRAFGAGGALSRAMGRFHANPMQVEYAKLALATAARGMVEATAGRLTVVEASTGTGKTQGCLVPALLASVATGKRSMYATNTRALLRQIMSKEAAVAVAAVREITGVTTTVAPYRSRASFVSATRAGEYAERLAAEGKVAESDALKAFVEHDRRAKERLAAGDVAGVVGEVDGLMESFVDDDPEAGQLVSGLSYDRWCINADSPQEERALWEAFRNQAMGANLVVVTHAALLQEMRFAGALLDSMERPYAFVVVDEAHLLEAAAVSALSDRRSVQDLAVEAQRAEAMAAGSESARGRRVVAAAVAVSTHAASLLGETRAVVDDQVGLNGRLSVTGSEPWIETAGLCERALWDLYDALGSRREEWAEYGAYGAMEELRDDVRSKARSIRNFRTVCAWRREHPGKKGFLVPFLRFTPVRMDPVIEVKPVAGQMILSRLWGDKEKHGADSRRMADAVFFTSATLGDPTKAGWAAFESRAFSLGIDRKRQNVNVDLCGSLEPEVFGFPTFFLAAPDAPKVSSGRDGDWAMTPESVAFAVHAIGMAAKTGTRVMVPVGSFRDADLLARAMPPRLRARTIPHERGVPAFRVLDAFVATEGAILISPSVGTGTDLAVPLDIVLTRLPYPPPEEDGDLRCAFVGMNPKMIARVRQVIGRAVRRHDDRPRIYVTDPQFGMTQRMRTRTGLYPAPGSGAALNAVPKRFRKALDEATLIPVPRGARA